MRIITGRFKRRLLLANPGLVTRPISDRVKETLFQKLTDNGCIEGRRVADVFSGTGTIGLEALSRGAISVTFFELDRVAFDLLHQNIATLGVDDECICWQTDILRTSFKPKGAKSHFAPYSLVFMDPPYKMAPDIKPGTKLNASLERLAKDSVTTSDAIMVLRIPERTPIQLPPCWEIDWTITTSRMHLHVCKKAAGLDLNIPVEEDELPSDLEKE